MREAENRGVASELSVGWKEDKKENSGERKVIHCEVSENRNVVSLHSSTRCGFSRSYLA